MVSCRDAEGMLTEGRSACLPHGAEWTYHDLVSSFATAAAWQLSQPHALDEVTI